MNDLFIRTDKQLSERNNTLKKIKKILDDLKIIFFLEGGVLLGAIRNKNFIKWDHDVEVGVFSDRINKKKILKILNKAHDSKLKIDFVDSRINNLKINLREHDHTKFSILGFKETKKNLERDMYKYPSNFFSPLDNINFLGKNYRIPNNVKDFLKWTYGDWQTEVKSRDIRVYYDKKAINSIFKIYIKKIIPRIKYFINKKRDQISVRDFFKQRESLFQSMINPNQDKTNRKRLKIINVGVSDKNRKKNQINFIKLDYFLKKHNKNNHLVLKMDLEGRETNVLKRAIKYLKKIKNISIVIKLNPVKYTNKDMYNIFKELFKNGYKVKFVESEINVIPGEFKKDGLLPIKVMGDRGLYKNVDKNYILKNAFKPSFKLINFSPGFTSNSIHSIMIEK